jgi:hypothetical protein
LEVPAHRRNRKARKRELSWCVANADKAPHVGWLREVYYHQGKLALEVGDQAKAQEYLRRSGYEDFDRPITLITPFSEETATGHAFAPRRISQIVPGRVYALSGFEFTEYYFIVSDNRRELIGIDAGTRPDSAKAAYEALQAYAPGLPELTTVFITHSLTLGSHWWAHILPRAKPSLEILREKQLRRNCPRQTLVSFSAGGFSENALISTMCASFKPDITIDRTIRTSATGSRTCRGSNISLAPTRQRSWSITSACPNVSLARLHKESPGLPPEPILPTPADHDHDV